MEKLKINIDDLEITIEADERFSKGIYIAKEKKTVKKNIEKLNIKFDNSHPENVLQNRITKIGTWSLLTSRAATSYLQFIFMPSADQNDFNNLIQGKDEDYRQLLINAYNMSKLNMNNIDILSEIGKSKN